MGLWEWVGSGRERERNSWKGKSGRSPGRGILGLSGDGEVGGRAQDGVGGEQNHG